MDNYNPHDFYEDNNSALNSFDDNLSEAKPDAADNKKINKHPVLTLQLLLVLCVTLFLFVVKFCSADLFSVIINRYESEVSKSLIYNGDFDSFDFSDIFSTDDEV